MHAEATRSSNTRATNREQPRPGPPFLSFSVACSLVRVTQEYHEVVGKAKNLKRLRPLLVASFARDLDSEVSSEHASVQISKYASLENASHLVRAQFN